jgi:hypothetical protein
MTDEEIVTLIQETSEQIEELSDKPDESLTRQERSHKIVLQAELQALKRIQVAKEKGNFNQEVKAGVDYTLLCKYGEKHPFLMNFLKSQMTWFGF